MDRAPAGSPDQVALAAFRRCGVGVLRTARTDTCNRRRARPLGSGGNRVGWGTGRLGALGHAYGLSGLAGNCACPACADGVGPGPGIRRDLCRGEAMGRRGLERDHAKACGSCPSKGRPDASTAAVPACRAARTRAAGPARAYAARLTPGTHCEARIFIAPGASRCAAASRSPGSGCYRGACGAHTCSPAPSTPTRIPVAPARSVG